MSKLLLLDGLNIVRRIYEAIPGDGSPEKAEGAMRSSLFSIRRAISEIQPTHFLGIFDAEGPNWRHAIYDKYKEDRKPMCAHLRAILPSILSSLNAEGLKTEQTPGVEAEDVIATIGIKAIARGFKVVAISNDKDLCSLISHGIEIRDHFKQEWRDEAWVQAKFGIPSKLICDFLALKGDDTDGIPGVHGVGDVIAAKWLNTYGGLDSLLNHAHEIKGKVGESLRASIEVARMSRQLSNLKMDVPLKITPKELFFDPTIALSQIKTRPEELQQNRTRNM